jgi:hypothetical protein
MFARCGLFQSMGPSCCSGVGQCQFRKKISSVLRLNLSAISPFTHLLVKVHSDCVRRRTTSLWGEFCDAVRRRTASYDVVHVNCMLMPRSLCTVMNINEEKYGLPLAESLRCRTTSYDVVRHDPSSCVGVDGWCRSNQDRLDLCVACRTTSYDAVRSVNTQVNSMC